MDAKIKKLIEQGRVTVEERANAEQAKSNAKYQIMQNDRLGEWVELTDNVREQLPEVLRDYLEWPADEQYEKYEGREIIASPMKYGEDVYLRIPGLNEIWVNVSKENDRPWVIERYRVRIAGERWDGSALSSEFWECKVVEEALFCAKVQAEEQAKKDARYEEQMREAEDHERLERDPDEQVIDVEKLLKQAKNRLDDTDMNYDPIARALIAIGWLLNVKIYGP